MNSNKILQIAMNQSAIDSNCAPTDFLSFKNKIVFSEPNENARKYLELPFHCDFTSYGNNIVASVSKPLENIVEDFLNHFSIEHCFETPNIHVLIEKLKPFDLNICFMAEYFLPDLSLIEPLPCNFETKILYKEDFKSLYLPQWSNALCETRKHLDVLAVGAFDQGQLIGLAGCSADCKRMWQIGIDVLPSYRKQGIASSLTNQLALEVIKRDIVPFYCCAWSNIKSVRNAITSGFKPAWVQMTVKTNHFINQINTPTSK